MHTEVSPNKCKQSIDYKGRFQARCSANCTHIMSGAQGDSGIPFTLSFDIFIMFSFCDAILIDLKLKISKDIHRYICHQLGWLPDPNIGSMGFKPSPFSSVGGWASWAHRCTCESLQVSLLTKMSQAANCAL